MNQVANTLTVDLAVGAVTRRRARTGVSSYFADGAVVMVLLAASLICYSYYNQMRDELHSARAERARVEATVAALEVDNARIAAEIRALETDPYVIEQAARSELGMIRPGEIVLPLDTRR